MLRRDETGKSHHARRARKLRASPSSAAIVNAVSSRIHENTESADRFGKWSGRKVGTEVVVDELESTLDFVDSMHVGPKRLLKAGSGHSNVCSHIVCRRVHAVFVCAYRRLCRRRNFDSRCRARSKSARMLATPQQITDRLCVPWGYGSR